MKTFFITVLLALFTITLQSIAAPSESRYSVWFCDTQEGIIGKNEAIQCGTAFLAHEIIDALVERYFPGVNRYKVLRLVKLAARVVAALKAQELVAQAQRSCLSVEAYFVALIGSLLI
jgi:hypothetical protein